MYTVTFWSSLVGKRGRDAATKAAAVAAVNEAMAQKSVYYVILSKGAQEVHWEKEDGELVRC